jgi:23S rRNA pseudouridine2605 synthase
LTHPKHHVEKTYRVTIKGDFKSLDINKFQNGLMIDGYLTKPSKLDIESYDDHFSHLIIKLKEGRNRQIRKMLAELGYEVHHLERISIGSLQDKHLLVGTYRVLSHEEINELLKEAD